MDPIVLGAAGFLVVLLLLAIRVPIAFALAGMAAICTLLFFATKSGNFDLVRAIRPTTTILFSNTFELIHSYNLSMVPLFIALGHVAYRAGITTDIYHAARIWLARIPGGVAMASIIGCGGFSAITGSSVACASAMGRICVPEMLRFNYDPRLATSSVAAGGTLGSLIPPSVLFIIYGIFTETSINKLFLAGVIPGLLSLLGFLVVIYIWVKRDPGAGPAPGSAITTEERSSAAFKAWPAFLLFAIVIGGIYGGVFTATEAAAISLSITLLISVLQRRLSLADFKSAMWETVTQTSAIFFIAASAKMFVAFIALTGIAPTLVGSVEASQLAPWLVLLAIVAIYLAMGMFLDPLGIMVLTLPFVVPLVEGMGLDLIWFGVVVVKLLEIGLITPPVGLNVFVISSVVGSEVPLERIFAGILRFLAMDIVVLALLVAFPVLSLLLPNSMWQ
ncbi:TRAP transporter large permease [Pelagibius sp. Alg239-R121]|uniref:TRAP transporter large permease n=1 Tax=Pelagibius sp. Alg239-R121 TaxID=2993448 RepID=UPI0024A6100D|nr:TRAP transporter large permease [Pelagibius sp. Alg239-R121]